MNETIESTRKALERRGYTAYACKDKAEASALILNTLLPEDVSQWAVGFGHSETSESLGIIENLRGRAKAVYYHKPPQNTAEDDRNALRADIYFLSANALSQDGYIVNIDGTGNRTAASCFGPKQVVYVVGRNKIAPDLDSAMDRALNTAAMNLVAKETLRKDLPCAKVGRCVECFQPGCVCGVMVVHRKQLFGNQTTVILVDEDLGI